MALLAPPSSPERYSAQKSYALVFSEKLWSPLDGGFVEGTLAHQGDFHELAVLVPGYLGIEKGYKPLARLLAMLNGNLAVATIEPVRQQPQKGMIKSRLTGPMLVPHRLLGQSAAAVVEYVTATHPDIHTVSLIGHSTGGPGALNAAKLAPVNNVILLASAGVTGHNIFSLAPQGPKVVWEGARNQDRLIANLGEESADFFMDSVKDLVRYAFTNPARTLGEAIAVGQCNAEGSIRRVRSLGTKVGGLFFNHDPFFPGAIAERRIGHDVDLFTRLDQNMGHLAPQTHTSEVAEQLHAQLAYLSQLSTRVA